MSFKEKDLPGSVLWLGVLILFTYISLIPFYYLSRIFKYAPLVTILIMSGFLAERMFKAGSFKLSRVNIAVYLFIGATLFSGIGLPYYRISLAKAVYYFITGALLYFLVTSVNLSIDKIKRFLQYAIILASLVAAYGILTFIARKDFLFGGVYSRNLFFPQSLHFAVGRILSSLGHPVFLGSYLAILSPLFLFNLSSSKTKYKQFIARLLYLVVMLAVLLTFSGGAYLAFIVANSLLIFFLQHGQSDSLRKLRLISLLYPSMILAVFFMIIAFTVIIDNRSINNTIFKILNPLFCGRVKFEELLALRPLQMRIDSLKTAWGILTSNPLTGIGIGNISSGRHIFNKFAMDNIYLSIVAESGLTGLIAFLFLNFVICKKLLKDYKNLLVEEHRLIILTLAACLVAFLVDSFYWDTFYHPTIRMLYWLIIAMAMVITKCPLCAKE
jgi:O-antigen ligase